MTSSNDRPRLVADEVGNTLVLVPVALILVLGLAALAVDATLLYLAERRLQGLTATVATDAAGTLDAERFYGPDGEVALDAPAAQERADDLVTRLGQDRSFLDPRCEVTIDGPAAIASCRVTARPLLPFVWSGLPGSLDLVATERAVAMDPADD